MNWPRLHTPNKQRTMGATPWTTGFPDSSLMSIRHSPLGAALVERDDLHLEPEVTDRIEDGGVGEPDDDRAPILDRRAVPDTGGLSIALVHAPACIMLHESARRGVRRQILRCG